MALLVFFLSALTTLVFVVDPLATVPVFLAVTTRDSAEQRKRTARRAALASTATLAGFGLFGTTLFTLLGISVGAFQIAGGILLLLLGIDMLRAQRSRQRTTPEEEAEGIEKEDASIFPLAIPMLAGPGATSTVMVLVSRAVGLFELALLGVSVVLVGLLTFVTLRAAGSLSARLGTTGLNVLQRVMGLVVSAFAIEFVVAGLRQAFPGLG